MVNTRNVHKLIKIVLQQNNLNQCQHFVSVKRHRYKCRTLHSICKYHTSVCCRNTSSGTWIQQETLDTLSKVLLRSPHGLISKSCTQVLEPSHWLHELTCMVIFWTCSRPSCVQSGGPIRPQKHLHSDEREQVSVLSSIRKTESWRTSDLKGFCFNFSFMLKKLNVFVVVSAGCLTSLFLCALACVSGVL